MKRVLLFFFIMLFSAGLAKAEVIDKILATVNDNPITSYELKELAPFYNVKNQKQLLNLVVDDYVIEDIAKKDGITATKEEVDSFIENVAKNNKITKEELKQKIKQEGYNYDYYKKFAAFSVYKFKVMQKVFAPSIQIDESEIKNFYNNHSNLFNQSNVTLDIIETPNKADVDKAFAQLTSGDNFNKVKDLYSVDKSPSKNIYLSDINKQLQNIIENMQIGQISPVIESNKGYYIIKLLDKKVSILSFDDVKDKIRNLLFEEKLQERFSSWLASMKTSMDISIFDED